jgi:type IV secretory pathway protease TraF
MMKRRRYHRKPDALLVLAASIFLAAVMTSTVKAGELIDYRPSDSSTHLVSLFLDEGYRHDPANPASSLQLSFMPPPVAVASAHAGRGSVKPSHVLLSWRIRW